MLSAMKPVLPSSMIFGTESLRHAIIGVPHASASIITSPKGSGQFNRENQDVGVTDKFVFVPSSHLPHEFHERLRLSQQRLDGALIVAAVLIIDLGGDFQFPPRTAGDFNRAIQALLGGGPPHKQQIGRAKV